MDDKDVIIALCDQFLFKVINYCEKREFNEHCKTILSTARWYKEKIDEYKNRTP